MLFNSLEYLLFLPSVFILYWFVFKHNHNIQNLLLLVSSYIFYGWWDWRFLFLLVFSTSLDYYTGIRIFESRSRKSKTIWLWISICINVGFLGFFKYFNFFITSFADALSLFGYKADLWTLKVILPVGISFYTFHGLSYVLDIYNNKIQPERNPVSYSVFVSFFPLLVAGPIERATHLLPQIIKPRAFNYNKAADGMRQLLWGFFKKIVIADNCSGYVNQIFEKYQHNSGATLLLGAILFGIQIYCDFSGYSDIALGTSRLFGIELLRNFAFPYFSRDIAEFWRRWHISLTTWFRDYIYIPLGGSKGGMWISIRNTFIIFLISGFWHGANWTFICWGLLNALYFLPLLLTNKNRAHLDIVAHNKIFPTLNEFLKIIGTFLLVSVAWIFFRSKNVHVAFDYIFRMQGWIFVRPVEALKIIKTPVLYCMLVFTALEWLNRDKQHALQIGNLNVSLRWLLYLSITFLIILYGSFNKTEFIYFAF
jgi:alginate O-acetyltransferase complex protein AlgI